MPRGHTAPRRAADDRPGERFPHDHDSALRRIGDARRRRRAIGRRSGRAADDEPRLEPAMFRRGDIPPLDDGQEELDGLLALLADRLVHRRERWVRVLAMSMSSKPTTLHVVGDAQAELARGPQRRRSPSRRYIARTPGRTKAVLPGALQRRDPALDGGWTDDDAFVAVAMPAAANASRSRAAPARHAVAIERGRRRRRLDADDRGRRGGRGPRVLGGGPGAPASSTSIDPCSGSAVESTSTNGRPARADLLDLRMVVTEPDGHDAVDRRPAHARASDPRRGEMKWRA